MIVFPNAKINIGLFVTEKRPDGFHNLETVFYPINWCDVLEAVPSENFHFQSTGLLIDGNSDDNLVVKAYQLLKKDFNIPNVSIHLHKIIPMGAGLGGGSSDAAYMLKLLNELFELNLSSEILENYARQLGSDCAFFIQNKPVFANQKGDIFSPISLDLKNFKILCVYPKVHVTTKEAYGGISPKPAIFDLTTIAVENIQNWKNTVFNDFEKHIFEAHPLLQNLKSELYQMGAVYSAMSGSGSTVFGIFSEKIELPEKFNDFECKWV